MGRGVNRLLDNPVLKKAPGYFLHQLDTKDTMGTDTGYLL